MTEDKDQVRGELVNTETTDQHATAEKETLLHLDENAQKEHEKFNLEAYIYNLPENRRRRHKALLKSHKARIKNRRLNKQARRSRRVNRILKGK